MAITSNKNYLQPTGFKLVINHEHFANTEYFAQSISHPGASVAPVEIPTSRIARIPIAGDKINYGEMTADIILDEDLKAYQEMQDWLERIVNEGHVPVETASKQATASDISLIIQSSHNNKNVTIKYKDCVPTSLGQIQLASNVTDVTFTTFNVSFRFTEFEIT